MSFKDNIRKLRRAKKMTQAELADLCGVSKGHIANIEQAKFENPSITVLEKIAQTLEVTVPELLGYITPTIEFTEPDISEFSTEELLKEIVRRIS